MKSCKPFEKDLVSYMHGELDETKRQALEAHLAVCEACCVELALQRETLELLDEVLAEAPAPEELVARREMPQQVKAHRSSWADYWHSPQLRAALITGAAASLFFFLSISLVTMRVMHRAEPRFEAQVAAPTTSQPKFKKRAVSSPTVPSLMKSAVGSVEAPEVSTVDTFAPVEVPLSKSLMDGEVLAEANRTQIRSRGISLPEINYFGSKHEQNTEQYDYMADNTFKIAIQNPLSTFSIDVDRAAYANVRRFLTDGRMPPPDAVRIEEMVNYFEYDYAQPEGDDPFIVSSEVAKCPWNNDHYLALIGLQGVEIEAGDLPPNNLVFLLDVSGSMNAPRKLPLLKTAMRLLVDQLRPEDRVSIVVYAGAAGLVLEPTADKTAILDAIERLSAGGSTAGGGGIELAYKTALDHFIPEGNNRVILATDGDFNVGTSSDGALTRLIENKRESGVFLTVLGFGKGNLKDSKMEKLADHGNGNYAYIDDILEAKKVLVNEMGGTLVTIAKDVKIQVEFNPAVIKGYRLIGYENRLLAKEDFDNDKKDAGELGAGHTVTALYELIPADSDEIVPEAGELKYQKTQLVDSKEMMNIKLRYKKPNGSTSKLMSQPVAAVQPLKASRNLRFASAVAEFGLLLRNSDYKGNASYGQVLERARAARGPDVAGYRAEFIRLVERAELLEAAK